MRVPPAHLLHLLNMKPLLQKFSFLVLLLCACLRIDARPAGGSPGLPAPSASIIIDSPAAGSEFHAGAPILIRATAVDPAGAILRAEFFDGDTRIGVSEIATFAPVPAGQPVQHYHLWEGAPVGPHKISVRAKDAAGNGLASPTVLIQVSKPKPASIQILAPKDLQIFGVAEEIAITAEAVDPSGIILSAGFYVDGELIGTATHDLYLPCIDPPCPRYDPLPAPPPPGTPIQLTATWRSFTEGKHAIEVRGTNLVGTVVVSPAVRIAVARPLKSSITFITPKEGDNGDGVMQIVVEDDSFSDTSAYELETSTDLRTWRSGGSFVNGPRAAFIREEASATDAPRFYRAKRVR